jgi:hypothetical protein
VNQKFVVLLALAVGIMAIVAVVMSGEDKSSAEAAEKLFPGINLMDVTKVEVASAESAVTIQLMDGEWRVEQKANYPAEKKKLSELVSGIGNTELSERKTSKPENFARLGVADPADTDSQGDGSAAIELTLTTPASAFSVLVGDESSGRKGSFVRKPGENQVWLTSQSVNVESLAEDWLEPIIIDVEAEEIARVVMQDGDARLEFVRGEDGEFSFQGLPEGRSLKYPSIAGEPGRALVKVRLEDVALHDVGRWQDAAVATFTLKNATEISVQAIQQDEDYWVHFSVERDAADAREYGDIGLWDYQVASYVFDDFVKTLDDLLEEPEAEEEVADGEAGNGPAT